MKYAHTALHVYPRPDSTPVLRGVEDAMQVALGLVEAAAFFALLWVIGALIGKLA